METHNTSLAPQVAEPFHTIKQAAEILGLQYHQLQRGIKAGAFSPRRAATSTRDFMWPSRFSPVRARPNNSL